MNPDRLARFWTALIIKIHPGITHVNSRLVLVGDGLKVPKTGKKMPAVKLLRQESENNTKPEYIRGRPRKYGMKVKLRAFLDDPAKMQAAPSPVYGETKTSIKFLSMDLFWRPIGVLVRFVAVRHPARGFIILMSTDLTLAPLEIIRLYGLRFKIELSFKQALRTIGVYAYHFWCAKIIPLTGASGNQSLLFKPMKYRLAILRKLNAYHRHIQVGIITQGLLQYLASVFPTLVWSSFGS